jgi:hypothetical protein
MPDIAALRRVLTDRRTVGRRTLADQDIAAHRQDHAEVGKHGWKQLGWLAAGAGIMDATIALFSGLLAALD